MVRVWMDKSNKVERPLFCNSRVKQSEKKMIWKKDRLGKSLRIFCLVSLKKKKKGWQSWKEENPGDCGSKQLRTIGTIGEARA